MNIIVNSEVSENTLDEIQCELSPLFGQIDFHSAAFKSHVAESVIELVTPATEWLAVCNEAANVFLSKLVAEAATDLYGNKSKIALILWDAAVEPIQILTSFIVKAVKNKTKISIGLPIPDEQFGTTLTIVNESEEFVAWVLSSYILQLEVIESVVYEIIKSNTPPAGMIQLSIRPDGGFVLKWMDRNQQEIHEVRI
jgi:hypothetical protein